MGSSVSQEPRMVWTWGCGDTEVWGCLGGNVGLNKKLASSPQPHAGESASRFFQVWNSYTERKRFQEISAPLKITSDFSSKSVCQPPAAKFLFFFLFFFFFLPIHIRFKLCWLHSWSLAGAQWHMFCDKCLLHKFIQANMDFEIQSALII